MVADGRTAEADGIWARETDDLLRGLTGGFLIGVPLLYTMETWWLGQTISMPRALLFLAIAYALNLGFVSYFGFRKGEPGSLHRFGDALEATALAVVASAVTLTLLHQIRADQPLDVLVGRVAVNTVPVSLGVSVANHILAPRASRAEPAPGEKEPEGGGALRGTLLDVGASFAGALFLSLTIAPTDELPMLAAEVPTLHLPAIVLFSLLLTYAIVFAAGFGGQEHRVAATGLFQRPVTETVAAYLTSLATCAGALWLFGQIGPGTDWYVAYAEVVLLGLPAAVGAAAGRLAV
jgi:putative integral membrane protein (TIGR02587 family)